MAKDDLDDVKKQLRAEKPVEVIAPADYLNTGSTQLNLALSGNPSGGYVKGCYYFAVGDSGTGKSWLGLTSFAEAAINESFDDYDFVFDNAEHGSLMDVRRHFGKRVHKRMRPPKGTRQSPVNSRTAEDFYYNLEDATTKGPCVYVLDSENALDTQEDVEHQRKKRTAYEKGKEVAGSYGTSKPKKHSSALRTAVNAIRDTKSVLIVLGQTRDNIGFGAVFNPKTRSGGNALTFYAHGEFWLSGKGAIRKGVLGKPRVVGMNTTVKVTKNRITGWKGKVTIPFLNFDNGRSGFDDLGGCVQYLIDEGHWPVARKKVKAAEFDFEGSAEDLIAKVEEDGGEAELRMIVAERWRMVEEASRVQRKSRYV